MANIKINSTPTRVQYEASGGQTTFTYAFPITADADLKVYQRSSSSDASDSDDLLTLTTNYTVTGAGTASGGTVVLVSGATAGDIVTIVGDKTIDRTAIYDQSVTLNKSDLNNDFNDNVIFDKQIDTELQQLGLRYNRSAKIGPSDRQDNLKLPILNNNEIWIGQGDDGDSPDNVTTAAATSIGGILLTGVDYVLGTANSNLSSAQVLGDLSTGLLKNTVASSTGTLSTALEGTDYYEPGGTDVAVVDGGTGASTASGARTNLGLGTISTQDANSVNIDGGAVDAVTLGTNSAVTEAQIDNVNINGNSITSTDTNGDLNLTPDGTGDLVLDGVNWPQADGTNGQVLQTDGAGQTSWTSSAGLTAATQSEMEAATDNTLSVTPANAQWHPSAASAFVEYDAIGASVGETFNVTSITDNGTGNHDANLTSNMGAGSYPATMSIQIGSDTGSALGSTCLIINRTASSFRMLTGNSSDALADTDSVTAAIFGDLA